MKNKKVKQFLFGSWYQLEGVGYEERVKEGDCSGNILYSYMKVEK
jgi:hypothetical protein